jgi:two-component system, cell cycle response regulator DivK
MMDKEFRLVKKSTIKILVVEDNAESMYLVTFLLESAGYTVLPATNGLSAVQVCQKVLPDLVLMDIKLPEIDGYEATRRIKQIPAISHIPIIAFTAFAMETDIKKALETGCVGHMEKPIDIQTFVQQIEAYLPTQQ